MSTRHGKTRYHIMDRPLNPSPLPPDFSQLNTVYQGRPVHNTQAGDRSNVVPENPQETQLEFENSQQEVAQYANALEGTTRMQGGGPKAKLPFATPVAPDMQTEDPNMMYAALQTNPISEGVSPATKEEINPHILIQPPIEIGDPSSSGNIPMPGIRENFEKVESDDDKEPKNMAYYILIALLLIFVAIVIVSTLKSRGMLPATF